MKERLRTILRRARGLASVLRDRFPLTAPGLVFTALVVLAARVGFAAVDLVLLGAAALGATTLVFAGLTVGLGAWRTHAALRLHAATSALSIECDRPVRTGFQLPRPWWIPGLRVTWRWTAPEAEVRVIADGPWLEEEVLGTRRGWSESLERRIELNDAFGLVRWVFRRPSAQAVRMLPSVGGLKQMQVMRTLSGGSDLAHPDGTPDGERFDLRQYAPGDPIRFVLWSVFARTRALVVRTPERALSAARKTLAYLVTGEADEPAAGAARVALEYGALGGAWAFGTDGVDAPAETREAAFEALARSRNADRAHAGEGLGTFLRQANRDGSGRAVVFVPARPGPWLDRLMQSAGTLPRDGSGRLPLEFMVCLDGVGTRPKRSGWSRLFVDGAEGQGSDAGVRDDELGHVVSALGSLRARVVVVDRKSGRVQGAGG